MRFCRIGLLAALLLMVVSARAQSPDVILLQQARACSQKGDFAGAQNIYLKLLKISPNHPDAELGLAYTYAWQKDYAAALSAFDTVIQNHPAYFDARIGKIRTLIWMENFKEAQSQIHELPKPLLQKAEVRELQVDLKKFRRNQIQNWAALTYELAAYSSGTVGHFGEITTGFGKKQKWELRTGAQFWHKFGFDDPGFVLGGTYWLNPKWSLLIDVGFAPDQIILARQEYQASINFDGPKGFNPQLTYRFADYFDADVHQISARALVPLSERFQVEGRMGLSFVSTRLGQDDTDITTAARVLYFPNDRVQLSMGYAFGQESFDSGNTAAPLGGFDSHHAFAGAIWKFLPNDSLDILTDEEWRSSGGQVTTLTLGLRHAW